MTKIESTLSRWAKYRLLVTEQIMEDTMDLSLNERTAEILKTAIALEAASIGLLKLAEKLGNTSAEEDMLEQIKNLSPIMGAFTTLMADNMSLLLDPKKAIDKNVKTKIRGKSPVFFIKGEEV